MTSKELARLEQLSRRLIMSEILSSEEDLELQELRHRLDLCYPIPELLLPKSVIEANKEADELKKIRMPKRRQSRPKLKE